MSYSQSLSPKPAPEPASTTSSKPAAITNSHSNKDALLTQIAELEATLLDLEEEYSRITKDLGVTPAEATGLQATRIARLHEYNEIKDAAQTLLGRCANIEETTLKDMYKKFEVEIED